MKVSLDGGITFVDATEGVRIVYQDVEIPGEEDIYGELHVNCTHEGIITDVWCNRESVLDHNIATRSQMVNELIDEMIADDS